MALVKVIAFNQVARLDQPSRPSSRKRPEQIVAPTWEGRSPYIIFTESSLIHSARIYQDGEQEVAGYRTIFCPAAEASGSSTELHVSEEQFDRLQDQLAMKLIEIEYSVRVEPYRQGDGLRTGEGFGTPTKRVHINASLIQSITYCRKPDADGSDNVFEDHFTLFMPPNAVGGAPVQLHVANNRIGRLVKLLEAHQLLPKRSFKETR
jgi:hypothetical protein